ncbi:ornithine cyclodeaminase/alanine dehydrogenase [Peptoniphilus ivorii]|uniref:ornithine cyclodeaminase family protein n=1 Tax=Aedoeadaptatus ivorii TaxID=54006 RepID=UPI00278346F0|nr:ornithine cyclodeaminase family protein [Peptoniphilus ivorii]MDQ0508379.1 ornithine cyclodeaminase/alanine dehydrogenase [Peptoniphilus ivorii]
MAKLLTYEQVMHLVNMEDAVDSVERTFDYFGKGEVINPTKVTLDLGESGGWPPYEGFFNAMPAYIGYQDNAGIKWVGGFLGHRKKANLPFICGMIILADPKLGIFRAVMDGKYITNLRTGAQTAVSLKHLFKERESIRIGLFGAGVQGHTQTEAISKVFKIEELRVYDIYKPVAEKFARDMEDVVEGKIIICDKVEDATDADVLITVTQAHEPFLSSEMIQPGTVVFPMGSYKEVTDELILDCDEIVVDHLEQALHRGALHRLAEQGKITKDNISTTIGELVAGEKKITNIEKKKVLCIPIGMGCLDVALAYIAYDRAKKGHVGFDFDFCGESYKEDLPERQL